MINRQGVLWMLAALAVIAGAPQAHAVERADSLAAVAIDAEDPMGALVREALANNLALRAARHAERRAAAERTAAALQWLPSVRFETRASELHDVQDLGALVNPAYAALNQLTSSNAFPTDLSLTLPQRYESHVRVTQPLFHEPLRASVAVASAQLDAERGALGTTARQLAAGVQMAWLQHASALRLVGVYEATLDLVLENERVAERLLAAGKVTPEAVHRARADRAELQQQLDDAREQAAAAAREFNRIAGRELEREIAPLPDRVFDQPLTLSADEAVRSALERREELAAAGAGVRAARAAHHAATGALLPNVAAALDVGWQGGEWPPSGDERSWTASLVASWDLFRGGSDLARRSAAQQQTERALLEQRDARERITVEVRNAHEAARVARMALEPAATRLESARRTYQLVHRRYEEGAASPVELVDARTSLTQAESNQVLTLYRYAIRRVDLERAAALRDLRLPGGVIR